MLEARQVKGYRFVIDQKGRLRNVMTGNYIKPSKSGSAFIYPPVGGKSVNTVMQSAWPEEKFKADDEWFLATQENVLVRKAIDKARADRVKARRKELANSGYWGAIIEAPGGQVWKTHPQFPKVEISETGLLRRKDNLDVAYTPKLSVNLLPIFRKKQTGEPNEMALLKVYRELFQTEWPEPGEERTRFKNADNFEFCPYALGHIQTLYDADPPDARFSPLDWQSGYLQEANFERAKRINK